MIRTDKNPRISSKRGKGKLLETEKKRSLYFVFFFFEANAPTPATRYNTATEWWINHKNRRVQRRGNAYKQQ